MQETERVGSVEEQLSAMCALPVKHVGSNSTDDISLRTSD